MDERPVRVSDAEREQTVELLREHLRAGRLTPEEFGARTEAALAARVGTDLDRIQDDLPRLPAQAPGSRHRAARLTTGLFGQVVRRGRLRLRGWTAAVSAFADVDFDLRETTITVRAAGAFGTIDIWRVPATMRDATRRDVIRHLKGKPPQQLPS